MKELDGEHNEEQEEMQRAIENFELHWSHRPLNSERVYVGMETINEEDLKENLERVRAEIREIASKQREGWGGDDE